MTNIEKRQAVLELIFKYTSEYITCHHVIADATQPDYWAAVEQCAQLQMKLLDDIMEATK